MTCFRITAPFLSERALIFLTRSAVMLKKFLSFCLSLVIIVGVLSVPSLAVSEAFSRVTTAKTPTSSAALKFSKKLGAGYVNAPTGPIVVEDVLIVAAGSTLYKLNAETGETIASAALAGSLGFATVSPTYADGKIFVLLDGGKIQAFSFKNFRSLWVYTDPLGGQAISPVTYDSGYVYTGFWNDEDQNANYVCLSVKDENSKKETEAKKARWTYKHKGGFYWAGCAVTESFVVVGSDDGKKGSTSDSKILCLEKKSGKLVSSLKTKGDLRSSVTYDKKSSSFFVSSKAGYVYRFKQNAKSGKLSSLKAFKACGAVTSTPVVVNSRLYFGCADKTAGRFVVLDASTMKEIYHSQMNGYPQSTALVSTRENGKTYVYMTYNAKPGGITVFEDSDSQKSAKKTELFSPSGGQSQYCICSVNCSGDGTLYYKNDSGCIFAVGADSASFIVRLINAVIRFLSKLLTGARQ